MKTLLELAKNRLAEMAKKEARKQHEGELHLLERNKWGKHVRKGGFQVV